MERLVFAGLLGLSLTLILAAKIAKTLDMSYKMFLRLGVLFCVAAAAPWLIVAAVPWLIVALKQGGGSSLLAWFGYGYLAIAVFDLISAFQSKGEVMPPSVPVKRAGEGGFARSARGIAFLWLMPLVFSFVITWSFPSLTQMSGWDMLAYGFFTMAAIVLGLRFLLQGVEICGNGLWHGLGSPPNLQPWEAFESFSWTEVTKDGFALKLQAKSWDQETTPLMVRPEDREVVQHILEANLPDQSSGAHEGIDRRIPPRCVRVRRTRRRRFARHLVSVLCWPAVVLLLLNLRERNVSLEEFSGVGFVSLMITMGVNFWPSKIIEICRKGLLVGDELRAWEQHYECFFWKGETGDGVELWLQAEYADSGSIRLTVRPEDREAVQQLIEAKLPDRSLGAEERNT